MFFNYSYSKYISVTDRFLRKCGYSFFLSLSLRFVSVGVLLSDSPSQMKTWYKPRTARSVHWIVRIVSSAACFVLPAFLLSTFYCHTPMLCLFATHAHGLIDRVLFMHIKSTDINLQMKNRSRYEKIFC